MAGGGLDGLPRDDEAAVEGSGAVTEGRQEQENEQPAQEPASLKYEASALHVAQPVRVHPRFKSGFL